MMKKLLLLMLVLLLAVPAAAEATLLDGCASQLTQDIRLQIADESYVAMYTGGFSEPVTRPLKWLSECTWQQPTHEVYLTVDMDALKAALAAQNEWAPEGVEALPAEYLPALARYAVAPPTSPEHMIITRIATANVTYIDPAQSDGVMMFIRFYADGHPVLFTVSAQDSAVVLTAEAPVCLIGMPEGQEVEALREYLNENGMAFVQLREEPVLLTTGGFPEVQGATLAQRAASLAEEAGRRMADPARRAVFGLTEAQDSLIAGWAKADYAAPCLMVIPGLDARVHGMSVWGERCLPVLAAEDSPAARRLEEMLPGSWFGALLNRFNTIDGVVAANATTTEAFYADPEQPDGSGVYLLTYTGRRMMMVSWVAENGVVCMDAQYLPLPDLALCMSATDMAMWFTRYAVPVFCTEATLD